MVTIVTAAATLGLAEPAFAAGDDQAAAFPVLNILMIAACPLVLWLLWRADIIRPGSLSRHRKRFLDKSPWPVWWVGIFLMFFAQAVGGAVGYSILGGQGETSQHVGVAIGGGLAGLAAGVWLVWFLHTSIWGARAGLDLHPRPSDFARGLLGLLASIPIVSVATLTSVLIAQRIAGHPMDEIAHETLHAIKDDPRSPRTWAMIFAAAVLAPAMEEILFRGLLQSAFLRLTARPWLSILATSLAFGAIHYGAVPPHAIPPLCIFGLCLGIAYERTGRLWVPITMHALFNAANIALVLAT